MTSKLVSILSLTMCTYERCLCNIWLKLLWLLDAKIIKRKYNKCLELAITIDYSHLRVYGIYERKSVKFAENKRFSSEYDNRTKSESDTKQRGLTVTEE